MKPWKIQFFLILFISFNLNAWNVVKNFSDSIAICSSVSFCFDTNKNIDDNEGEFIVRLSLETWVSCVCEW